MSDVDDETLLLLLVTVCLSLKCVWVVKKRKRQDGRSGPRKRQKIPDYWASQWGATLQNQDEMMQDPEGRRHQQFRLRFRVPFAIYLELVNWTSTWYDKTVQQTDALGNSRVPVELLVLGVLRMLGRSTCLDGIQELSGISPSVMSVFFHKWCQKAAEELYPVYVKFPKTQSDIDKVMYDFAYVGFPGCLGSMDVVHVHWERCPSGLSVMHTGKEGYPTIAYQVIVDHSGRALACTRGFYGSWNDKIIVKFDGVIKQLRAGSHKHVKYKLYTADGSQTERSNVWIMVDGGYLKWEVTIAASSTCCTPAYVAWRKKLESVRKDVECFFGRLKQRFRILKGRILIQDKQKVDNIFLTCVALQNMLHEWDGLGNWKESDVVEGEIEGSDVQYWAADDARTGDLAIATGRLALQGRHTFVDESTSSNETAIAITRLGEDESERYDELEAALVTHFSHLMKVGRNNGWLRS